jgi:hypothetical protein
MIKNNWENKKMPKAVIENKSSVNLHGLRPGEKKTIEVDKNNTPLDKEWRRRIRDSDIDGCVKLSSVENNEKVTKETKEE